jgi:hypothetical protein
LLRCFQSRADFGEALVVGFDLLGDSRLEACLACLGYLAAITLEMKAAAEQLTARWK